MQRLIWAGLALLLYGAPGFAQTAVPPPAGRPTTGDLTKPLPPEPANIIEKSGLAPGLNTLTEDQVRGHLERDGYRQVAMLNKGDDGIWRGAATKDGSLVHVSVDFTGYISGRRTDAAQPGASR